MISVHAISLVYELRILRSRLRNIVARNQDVLFGVDLVETGMCLDIIENMIRKVESYGTYVQELEDAARRASEAEAGVGQELQRGDADHGVERRGRHRAD